MTEKLLSSVETSILVRTFNEEKHLGRLFDAFDRQRYQDFEVIVADSGSLDRTREIADARADHLVRIDKHDFTFGFSLNAGIRVAQGRFIVIVSAHTVPMTEDWLGKLIAPLREQRVAMSYGRQTGVASSKFSEAEDLERAFGVKPRITTPINISANNANAAIARSLWKQRPFDAELTGLEDIDWARHWIGKGYEVRYVPEAALAHIHEETWLQIRHRYYREAVAYRRMGLKGPGDVPGFLCREAFLALEDFRRALVRCDNPVCARLTWDQRLREIVYYRFHKCLGTVRGLTREHALETRAAQEEVLFDRPMDAVVVHGPNKAAVEKVEIPEIRPGEVLIRVAHVAVCATDVEIFNGSLGYYKSGAAEYPIIPGHEFSGRIAAAGPNALHLAPGDPVVVECIQACENCDLSCGGNFIRCAQRIELGVVRRNGGYAEYVAVPAHYVHKLPKELDLRTATLVEPLAVILKALRRLEPALTTLGDGLHRCAVVGAGPFGRMCAMELVRRSYQVTIIDHNAKRLEDFEGTGIETAEDFDSLDQFEVFVELTGNANVLNRLLHDTPTGSIILTLGFPYGEKSFSFEKLVAEDKIVIGSVGSGARDFDEAIALLPQHRLDPYLTCTMPLKETLAAWEKSRSGDVLKIILDIGEELS